MDIFCLETDMEKEQSFPYRIEYDFKVDFKRMDHGNDMERDAAMDI